MPNDAKTGWNARQAIVAAIVGLGFLLQTTLVPLHLAWSDHVLPPASGAQLRTHAPLTHAHDGHRHDGGDADPDEPGSDHEPHPVSDHLDQLADPGVPPLPARPDLARAPRTLVVPPPDRPAPFRADEPAACPRPPPPRDAAPARAPPIAS